MTGHRSLTDADLDELLDAADRDLRRFVAEATPPTDWDTRLFALLIGAFPEWIISLEYGTSGRVESWHAERRQELAEHGGILNRIGCGHGFTLAIALTRQLSLASGRGR